MEEKYEKFMDKYMDILLIFWEAITDALSVAWKILEVIIFIPLVMLMIFVTFPFYCIGCLIKKLMEE